MLERLTTIDASFLYLEESDAPMHVAGVLLLEPPAGGLGAIAALASGRTLADVAPASPLREGLRALAVRVTGVPAQASRRSRWRGGRAAG